MEQSAQASDVLRAPPKGSRLRCGRLARRRKSSGRPSAPARDNTAAAVKSESARQVKR